MGVLSTPVGEGRERDRLFGSYRPSSGAALQELTTSIHAESQLSLEERELLRLAIATINDCQTCLAQRPTTNEADGLVETFYESALCDGKVVAKTEREQLAIEFGERFALDHHGINDDFFVRLREHFDEGQILDLAMCSARYLGFGRLTKVLRLS
jgi:alkylhydroperoxidase family enzyme